MEMLKYLLHYNFNMASSKPCTARESLQSVDSIHGYTVIHLAAHMGRTNILRELVHFANSSPASSSAINAPSASPLKQTPLQIAAKEGNVSTVVQLIHLGANADYLDSRNYTCLHYAVRYGRLQTLNQLIGKLSPNTHSPVSLIHVAVRTGHWHVVQRLMELGYSIDEYALIEGTSTTHTVLYWAASKSTIH